MTASSVEAHSIDVLRGRRGRVHFAIAAERDSGPTVRTIRDEALDRVVLVMSDHHKRALEWRGRERALAFDRVRVFDDLLGPGRVPVGLPDEQAV